MEGLRPLRWAILVGVLAEVFQQAHGQVNTGGSSGNTGDAEDYPLSEPMNARDDFGESSEPGVVHWALAGVLVAVLISGLVQVYRVLHGLDVASTAIRNVPEGMRLGECGACHTRQYFSTHGRIFICFGCRAANRIPRDTTRSEHQPLVVSTGPLRSYEFRKGGENYWQELSQVELPPAPEENVGENVAVGEVRKLHYRGVFCIACGEVACTRLAEFPADTNAAYLAEAEVAAGNAAEGAAGNAAGPQIIGRQIQEASVSDEIQSQTSSRTNADGLPQCAVCLDKSGCMVLLPCAHGGVCEDCATRIVQNRASGGCNCPHCRAGIEILVKLHKVETDVARGVEVRIPMARPP